MYSKYKLNSIAKIFVLFLIIIGNTFADDAEMACRAIGGSADRGVPLNLHLNGNGTASCDALPASSKFVIKACNRSAPQYLTPDCGVKYYGPSDSPADTVLACFATNGNSGMLRFKYVLCKTEEGNKWAILLNNSNLHLPKLLPAEAKLQ